MVLRATSRACGAVSGAGGAGGGGGGGVGGAGPGAVVVAEAARGPAPAVLDRVEGVLERVAPLDGGAEPLVDLGEAAVPAGGGGRARVGPRQPGDHGIDDVAAVHD